MHTQQLEMIKRISVLEKHVKDLLMVLVDIGRSGDCHQNLRIFMSTDPRIIAAHNATRGEGQESWHL